MSDDSQIDFLHWLCHELEREEQDRAVISALRCGTNTIALSELEATGLLFLALDVEHHVENDDLTFALAHRLTDVLRHRLEAASSRPISAPWDGI